MAQAQAVDPAEIKTFPIFLIGLDKKRCIVIGGTKEAQRKVKGLLDCNATVTLIAKTINAGLQRWVNEKKISWVDRDYQPGDLKEAFLVISTVFDPQLNEHIWHEAENEGTLINIVDDPRHCNFIAGSIVRQGPLAIAISTGGCAPALAVRLRQRMEREFGPEYSDFLALLGSLREKMSARYPNLSQRRAIWYELVDSEIIDLLQEGKLEIARSRAAEIIGDSIEQ